MPDPKNQLHELAQGLSVAFVDAMAGIVKDALSTSTSVDDTPPKGASKTEDLAEGKMLYELYDEVFGGASDRKDWVFVAMINRHRWQALADKFLGSKRAD